MAPFKFYCPCPQSIMLESDTSQAGQQCQCPTCGLMFVVPSPDPAHAAPQQGYTGPQQGYGYGQPAGYDPGPNIQVGPGAGQPYIPDPGYGGQAVGPIGPVVGEAGPAANDEFQFGGQPQDDPNRIVTVICPNGCELETPMEMIGTDAMCPQCNAQFRLRYEDTLEYKQERAEEKERREHAFSENALKWAIALAVIIGLGIIGMFVMIAIR